MTDINLIYHTMLDLFKEGFIDEPTLIEIFKRSIKREAHPEVKIINKVRCLSTVELAQIFDVQESDIRNAVKYAGVFAAAKDGRTNLWDFGSIMAIRRALMDKNRTFKRAHALDSPVQPKSYPQTKSTMLPQEDDEPFDMTSITELLREDEND